MDYAALKTYIEADPAFANDITIGSDEGIAQKINARSVVGYVETEVGVGTILETLGLASGNALLDAIKSTPNFRHVWPLIEQGRLRLDSPVTQGALDQLAAGGVISVAEAIVLKAKAQKNLPILGQNISHNDVAKALRG